MTAHDLTPVQEIAGMRFKRDDLYAPFGAGGVNGGKLRQCMLLVEAALRRRPEATGIITYSHPVEFVEDIIGATPDPEQAKILRSVEKNKLTTVRSGHGGGKSTVEAWVIIWFMLTRPFPKIPCTAPTQHQLFDILWAEVSKWIRHNPALADELVWTKEKVYMRGYPEEWFAVARTASKPDALQGFHADDLLFIIDEASGVADNIFEPALGALSTPGSRLLMCGNPTQLSGFFYDSHKLNIQIKTLII